MKIKKRILLVILIFLLTNCQYFKLLSYKEWKDYSDNKEVDVYVAGNYILGGTPVACYWKNGNRIDLSPSNAGVSTIAIEGGKIYCAGAYHNGINNNACYWIDGNIKKVHVDEPNTFSVITHLVIIGGVVFGSGYENNRACYWIDSNKHTLPNPSIAVSSQAESIYVDENTNYYIAGFYNDATSNSYTCYWVNGGECITIGDIGSFSYSIYLSSGNIYIAGAKDLTISARACYWKNGKINVISNIPSVLTSIYIDKDNIYTCGQSRPGAADFATSWRNNVMISQETSASGSESITTFNNDVYFTGYVGSTACYWKNGNINYLPLPAGAAVNNIQHPYSIIVRARI